MTGPRGVVRQGLQLGRGTVRISLGQQPSSPHAILRSGTFCAVLASPTRARTYFLPFYPWFLMVASSKASARPRTSEGHVTRRVLPKVPRLPALGETHCPGNISTSTQGAPTLPRGPGAPSRCPTCLFLVADLLLRYVCRLYEAILD